MRVLKESWEKKDTVDEKGIILTNRDVESSRKAVQYQVLVISALPVQTLNPACGALYLWLINGGERDPESGDDFTLAVHTERIFSRVDPLPPHLCASGSQRGGGGQRTLLLPLQCGPLLGRTPDHHSAGRR